MPPLDVPSSLDAVRLLQLTASATQGDPGARNLLGYFAKWASVADNASDLKSSRRCFYYGINVAEQVVADYSVRVAAPATES